MAQAKYLFILSLSLLFTLESCKDPNEYKVDNTFAVYVQRFENEALTRGRTFDLKTNGLIVEFADLKNDEAGLCHFEDPIRIEIDKTYWNDISKTNGADMMKEDLLFHELGHGLLGRKHLNTTLENDDWKSIMCGGDKVDDRPWNINYRGMRRNYYIDELFNESTLAPDFSSNQLLADTSGYLPVLQLSFDTETKKDAGFDLVDNKDFKTSIDNGRLRFQSKLDMALLFFTSTTINIQSDFSYEMTFEYPASDLTNQYGLVFGTRAEETNPTIEESIEYYNINNNRKIFMGNRTWYSFYTQLSNPNIIAYAKNKLKVLKISNMLYYFINNVYCYCSEMEAKDAGKHFGFMVPPKAVLLLDNLCISQKNSSGVSSQRVQSQVLDYEVVKVKSLNQNNVKNQ